MILDHHHVALVDRQVFWAILLHIERCSDAMAFVNRVTVRTKPAISNLSFGITTQKSAMIAMLACPDLIDELHEVHVIASAYLHVQIQDLRWQVQRHLLLEVCQRML